MKSRRRFLGAFAAAALLVGSPAFAGWKLLPASKPVAVGTMTIVPQTDWNRASNRPGKQGDVWTHDGLSLNAIEFFAGVPAGAPLYQERDRKHNPLPKFDPAMLLPDYADFFERSFRTANGLSDFTVIETAPAKLGEHSGIVMRFRYSEPDDELQRSGIARLAVVNGKLYCATFRAPTLHYFDAGLAEALAMMDSAKF